ncbi:shikimate dehydrogenase [Ramlibacter sp. H39-3-26]|uniref:shikimate dehydrogenase n=1 Tax=Curvibacter soli TaxID=3031331 RepID=UPI0023DCBAED|nr:shikimate dehydrogenase [Ramlibacter sp. H39-3-26]MDF1484792.1 shikimate dehydrogenase [Ramlibacter sp. H39-3-26]
MTLSTAPDRYCVMGNPVEHSRSPAIHARFAELTGQRIDYGRHCVPLRGFADAVQRFAALGGRGCNVTVPFKFEAFALASRHSVRATLAGAANTLLFTPEGIDADNTDGAGLVADIERNAGLALAGRALLLVGAGGAAAGVLGSLIAAGPARVLVVNRSADKAHALVRRHAALAREHGVALAAGALGDAHEPFDVVINGTASSLAGDAVPVAADVLRPGTLAVDMMYGPAAQGFLDWARAHGAVPRDGLGMLVEQAAQSFALWRGVRPPAARVLAELRASLAA